MADIHVSGELYFPANIIQYSQFDSDYFIVDKEGSSESGQ